MKIAKTNKKHCRTSFGRVVARLTRDEQGAVAMEYIVIALLVAAAVVGLVMVFSGNLRNMLGMVNKTPGADSVETIQTNAGEYKGQQEKLQEENAKAQDAGNQLGGDFGNGGGNGAGGQTNP